MGEFSHFDQHGNAVMVDVTKKKETTRTAIAQGKIKVNDEIFEKVKEGSMAKGDVLGTARIAGIMAAKKTFELIPMCHLLMLTKCKVDFEMLEETKEIKAVCLVKTTGKTGVEMEALTGVQIALLTIYDMCKAIDKHMVMSEIHLVEKTGGKSGDFFCMEGIIKAVCISEKRGTVKKNINEVNVIKDFGLEGDAHAGKWHRQVSFLSADIVDEFNEKGASVIEGDFGENILAYGIDFKKLPVGTKLICNDAKFEITQIGKECHSHCEIYKRVGDCIMPREGIFAKVLESGTIKVGDKIEVIYPEKDMPYMAAVMTLSDKGSRGERVDTSGPRAAEILKEHGFKIVEEILLPDEEAQIKKHLIRLSDSRQVDLIITTGGTGLSPRDRTPEATLAVADRNVPGISEAIRAGSMTITKRAMLSRGVSVIRKKTLIINLPGSKKAVEESLSFIIDQLPHGLDTLRENTEDCGRN